MPSIIIRVICPVCKKSFLEEVRKGKAMCRKCEKMLFKGPCKEWMKRCKEFNDAKECEDY